jgi:hypothetical protein
MCKSKEEFKNVLIDHIPTLIKDLSNVSTEYAYERKYIGEAITYLRYLHSIMDVSSASGVPAAADLKGLKAWPAMPCGNEIGCNKCANGD